MIPSNLMCPLCSEKLDFCAGALKCGVGHSYDISASGYVNLLNPGKMNNFKSGDSKEMVRARTLFLSANHYYKASAVLCDIIAARTRGEFTLIDAGCGEGYYTLNVARTCGNSVVIGFDASKAAVEYASKSAKKIRLSDRAFFSAANIFSMPVFDESCDVLLNLFAPEADFEFRRSLKPGGLLVVGSAGSTHLYELKTILYGGNARLNEARGCREIDGFMFGEKINVTYKTYIESHDTLMNLFKMTPYYHKTPNDGKTILEATSSLGITVDFNFFVYHKK